MRVIINHLTRMQKGFMCVAGLEVETQMHIRPVVHGRLSTDFLARRLGPFEMAHEIDLGLTQHVGKPPEVEDYKFDYRRAKSVRVTALAEFWQLLLKVSQRRLRDIFGPQLTPTGTAYTMPEGQGQASLGCLIPMGRPTLYTQARSDRAAQVRMRFSDGVLNVDAGVADIRLYGSDHVTADAQAIAQVSERIGQGIGVILSVGLTRPYAPRADMAPLHWLQVNNIHLADNTTWPLG